MITSLFAVSISEIIICWENSVERSKEMPVASENEIELQLCIDVASPSLMSVVLPQLLVSAGFN